MITYYTVKKDRTGKPVLYYFDAKPHGIDKIAAAGMMPCFGFATRIERSCVSESPDEALEQYRIEAADSIARLEREVQARRKELAELPMHVSELETRNAVEQ